MANDVRISTAARNAIVDALVDLIDGGSGAGTIKIYTTGSGRPAGPGTAITDQVLLATLTFSDPAFGNSSGGTATASAITQDSSADATGTATWARIADSNATAIMDVEVGTSGADINFNSVAFTAGSAVSITSMTVSKAA